MPDFTFDKNNEWPKTVTFDRPGKYICYITDEIMHVDHRAMNLKYSDCRKRRGKEDALPS